MSFFENEIEHWRKIIKNVKKEKKLMKLVIAYFVIAFLSFDFLFGIAKQPFRDINTLNASDRAEFLKVTKEFRVNREKIFEWEREDHTSGYADPSVSIIIKKFANSFLTTVQTEWELPAYKFTESILPGFIVCFYVKLSSFFI